MPYQLSKDGVLMATGEMRACLELLTEWFRERNGRSVASFDELAVWIAALCSLAKGEWEYWGNSESIDRLDAMLGSHATQKGMFDALDLAAQSVTAKRLRGWKPDLLDLVERASS